MFYIEHVYTSWRKSHSWSEHIELISLHLPLSPPESNQSCFDSLLLVKIKTIFLFYEREGIFIFFIRDAPELGLPGVDRCWTSKFLCCNCSQFLSFIIELTKFLRFNYVHWDYKRGSYWYWYWYWTYMQEWFILA